MPVRNMESQFLDHSKSLCQDYYCHWIRQTQMRRNQIWFDNLHLLGLTSRTCFIPCVYLVVLPNCIFVLLPKLFDFFPLLFMNFNNFFWKVLVDPDISRFLFLSFLKYTLFHFEMRKLQNYCSSWRLFFFPYAIGSLNLSISNV